MTDPATGTIAEEITRRLNRLLSPTHLEVINESALHSGHMGDDGSGESHFRVIVESPRFSGVSRLERQRMINRELADLLEHRVHALAIKARAAGES